MSITHRNGHINDYDKNKLTPFQWAFPSDGTIRCCISPGVEKIIATKEDLQQILTSSPEAYTALQQLLSDLELNPSELTNILSNISALQTNKLDKVGDSKDNTTTFAEFATDTDIVSGEKHSTFLSKILKSIKTLRSGKIDKTSIGQTDIINDANKVASTTITYAHGQSIANLATLVSNTIVKVPETSITVLTGLDVYNYSCEGIFMWLGTTDTWFTNGYLHAFKIERYTYGGSLCIVQTFTVVYLQSVTKKFYRVYYAAGGWSDFKSLT